MLCKCLCCNAQFSLEDGAWPMYCPVCGAPLAVDEPGHNINGICAFSKGAKKSAIGKGHYFVLLENGLVYGWGSNAHGQLAKPKPKEISLPARVIGNAIDIALGSDHSLALIADGTVLSWGEGKHGQLGRGIEAESFVPRAVALPGKCAHIYSYGDMSAALLENGEAWAWGRHKNIFSEPFPVLITENAYYIYLDEDGFAVLEEGNLITGFCCDSASSHKTFSRRKIESGKRILAVCPKGYALDEEGALYKTTLAQDSPLTRVLASKSVKHLFSMGHASFAATEDGSLYSEGQNQMLELSPYDMKNRAEAGFSDTGALDIVHVASQRGATLLIDKSGRAFVWGAKALTYFLSQEAKACEPIKLLPNCICVAHGSEHTIALDGDGNCYSWGANSFGQLGRMPKRHSYVPLKVRFPQKVKPQKAFASKNASYIIEDNGQAWAWGQEKLDKYPYSFINYGASPVKIDQIPALPSQPKAFYESLYQDKTGEAHKLKGSHNIFGSDLFTVEPKAGIPSSYIYRRSDGKKSIRLDFGPNGQTCTAEGLDGEEAVIECSQKIKMLDPANVKQMWDAYELNGEISPLFLDQNNSLYCLPISNPAHGYPYCQPRRAWEKRVADWGKLEKGNFSLKNVKFAHCHTSPGYSLFLTQDGELWHSGESAFGSGPSQSLEPIAWGVKAIFSDSIILFRDGAIWQYFNSKPPQKVFFASKASEAFIGEDISKAPLYALLDSGQLYSVEISGEKLSTKLIQGKIASFIYYDGETVFIGKSGFALCSLAAKAIEYGFINEELIQYALKSDGGLYQRAGAGPEATLIKDSDALVLEGIIEASSSEDPNSKDPKENRFNIVAVSSTGKAYSWGFNSLGQLGTGDTLSRAAPSCISDPSESIGRKALYRIYDDGPKEALLPDIAQASQYGLTAFAVDQSGRIWRVSEGLHAHAIDIGAQFVSAAGDNAFFFIDSTDRLIFFDGDAYIRVCEKAAYAASAPNALLAVLKNGCLLKASGPMYANLEEVFPHMATKTRYAYISEDGKLSACIKADSTVWFWGEFAPGFEQETPRLVFENALQAAFSASGQTKILYALLNNGDIWAACPKDGAERNGKITAQKIFSRALGLVSNGEGLLALKNNGVLWKMGLFGESPQKLSSGVKQILSPNLAILEVGGV